MNFVESQLKVKSFEKPLWTDSQCVLGWTKTKKTLATFVDNKVKAIRNNSDLQFQYVASGDNPTDIVSRGT